jgi:hypothetical protein
LFQAFSQIDSGLARKFEGTGLGLAMVRQLAELQGGAVAVASAVGVGACFGVWLPCRAAPPVSVTLAHDTDTTGLAPRKGVSTDVATRWMERPMSLGQLKTAMDELGVLPPPNLI